LKVFISQRSVVTQLRCGGIFNNRITENCPQSVTQFLKSSIFGEDMDKSMVACFFWLAFYNR